MKDMYGSCETQLLGLPFLVLWKFWRLRTLRLHPLQIEFFKHTSSDDHTPNTIGFMFNPVKIDGVWYLAVKEATKEATDK